MPPAPKLGSDELIAEMAEVYSQALLRDVPFNAMMDKNINLFSGNERKLNVSGEHENKVAKEIDKLNDLAWFKKDHIAELTPESQNRRRGASIKEDNKLKPQNVFRGRTKGDEVGPYISQFLLAGSKGIDESEAPQDGWIQYGSIGICQKVRTAIANKDYMECWNEWFDAQNGIKLDQKNMYDNTAGNKFRFIATPRDMATYVHNDALYESYLNACLLLLANNAKFDEGIPFQNDDYRDHQQGFAHFGGPHILTLLPEVATRALKAVRYQKFNIHRRMRPEVLAARLDKYNHDNIPSKGKAQLKIMFDKLQSACVYDSTSNLDGKNSRLLPMAFPEGSPMHPSYGAGHATAAGACVTILKAFFKHDAELDLSGKGSDKAFVARADGKVLDLIKLADPLTVEGELNKLASNISIGRDWAGVHYYSDYIESLRMGEKIAIGILEEQKITYNESFSMTIPLFDGGCRTI